MSGGGVGGTLGSLAGAALAPETGGLSLLIPAIAGAGGAYLGGRLTGDKNPLVDALLGGIGGGLSGALNVGGGLGIDNAAGLFGDGATAAGATGASAGASGLTQGTQDLLTKFGAQEAISPALAAADPSLAAGAASGGASSMLGGIGKYIAANPLKAALAGNVGLSAIQSLLPHTQVDVGKNAANVINTNPNFNAQLPKYTMQNTATPYTGDWYKYGESPQTPLYNAIPMRAAHGGLVGYAHGGRVHGYADGGQIPQPGMPPQMAAPSQVNPLAIKTAHDIGVRIGKHLRQQSPLFTGQGKVSGQGGGQDDAVPAKLSDGEYVIPADAVAHLGDGSSDAGGKALDKMVHNVRAQKSVKGFPPKAKNPLSYIKKGAA